jgi:hypothetical protein
MQAGGECRSRIELKRVNNTTSIHLLNHQYTIIFIAT